MRALVQRVSEGGVYISANNYSADIKRGLVILLGIKTGDTIEDAIYVADKCTNLRIFEDSEQKMNTSVKDINGDVLIISQFTLYGDTSKVTDLVLLMLLSLMRRFLFMRNSLKE